MKINVLVDTGEKETKIVNGIEVEVPIMKSITRDMTAEEEAEYLANQPQDTRTYEQKVEDFMRERYTVSDELAILRQRDTKPEEFAGYNEFAELCKQKAK